MPAYNAAAYIAEAIDSILNQTFTNFEFLIINDGSQDDTLKIIESYRDKRIRFINLRDNIGLIDCLNLGIEEINTPYICRMDADDISVTTRIEDQINELEGKPQLGVCGGWYSKIDTNELIKLPVTHNEISIWLLKGNPLSHPTAIMRTSILKEHNIRYNKSDLYNEDYGFWIQMNEYTSFYNIPKVLLNYRIHPNQISISKYAEQKVVFNALRKKQFYELLGESNTSEYPLVDSIIDEDISYTHELTNQLLQTLAEKLLKKNIEIQKYNTFLFESFVEEFIVNAHKRALFNSFINAPIYNFKLLGRFKQTLPQSLMYLKPKQCLFFSIKCIVNYAK